MPKFRLMPTCLISLASVCTHKRTYLPPPAPPKFLLPPLGRYESLKAGKVFLPSLRVLRLRGIRATNLLIHLVACIRAPRLVELDVTGSDIGEHELNAIRGRMCEEGGGRAPRVREGMRVVGVRGL